jgi:shikimate dehydrogenase
VRRFAGVLGWPLEHTLSPAIHNAAFRRLDLDWVYLAFPVPPERLEQAVAGLRVLGAVGANVTMPHKETVMSLLDELSGDARSVGAVNTIQTVGDRLIGHNTDVDGFSRFLTADAGLKVKGSRALVLGAGGAARAVVRALLDLEVESVSVAARDAERGRRLSDLGERVEDPVEWAVASARVEDFDLVVNATPLGAAGEDPLPTARFRMGQAVVDLVYEPPATPLVARARESGAAGWNGLGMLVHQAAAALRIWSGQEPPVEAMSVAALHALTRR